MPDTERYDAYEISLQTDLTLLCCQRGWLQGRLMHSEDLEKKWQELAPEFLQEAVREYNAYPIATLAWAGYIGMAEAAFWDEDWEHNKLRSYKSLQDEGGFDTMDEYILRNILHVQIDSDDAKHIDDRFDCLANTAQDRLRHEGVEPGSQDAFYLFTRTLRVLYRTGVALELYHRGYKWEAM